MTEDQLEHDTLAWLADVGWQHRYGSDIAPDGTAPERNDYRQVLLVGRLRQAITALNPGVPALAREADRMTPMVQLGVATELPTAGAGPAYRSPSYHRIALFGELSPRKPNGLAPCES